MARTQRCPNFGATSGRHVVPMGNDDTTPLRDRRCAVTSCLNAACGMRHRTNGVRAIAVARSESEWCDKKRERMWPGSGLHHLLPCCRRWKRAGTHRTRRTYAGGRCNAVMASILSIASTLNSVARPGGSLSNSEVSERGPGSRDNRDLTQSNRRGKSCCHGVGPFGLRDDRAAAVSRSLHMRS